MMRINDPFLAVRARRTAWKPETSTSDDDLDLEDFPRRRRLFGVAAVGFVDCFSMGSGTGVTGEGFDGSW